MSITRPRTIALFTVALLGGLLTAARSAEARDFDTPYRDVPMHNGVFTRDLESPRERPVRPISRERLDSRWNDISRSDRDRQTDWTPSRTRTRNRFSPERQPRWDQGLPDREDFSGRYDNRRDDFLRTRDDLTRTPRTRDLGWNGRFPEHAVPTDYRVPNPDLNQVPDFAPTPIPAPVRQPTPQTVPRVQPSAPAGSSREMWDKQRARIGYRYRNPVTQRMVRSLDANRGLSLYRECNGLIDGRHLTPTPYAERVRRAIWSLSMAVETPEFQQSVGARWNATQVRAFQQTLSNVSQTPIADRAGAEQMLRTVMDLANRQLRIPAGAVTAEFVHAAADSLDKYSAFEPKSDQSAAAEPVIEFANLDGSVVGIGVEIKLDEGRVRILKVLPNGPAQLGGLRSGDEIITINGRSVRGMALDAVVGQIAGPVGSPVMIGFGRNGRDDLVTLSRQRVKVATVSEVKMLDPLSGVGYLKLDRFGKTSTEEVDKALWQLHRGGMKTLVFDVRGNPGGLLTTAIEISNRFLPCGTIVSTRGRTEGDNSRETAQYGETWKMPVIVLVDNDSASASEIFAAAIQDNDRGLVVGETSYGKGTVQTHFPLRTVSGTLRLTTAKFYSPSGREMAGNGVTPDVPVRPAGTALSAPTDPIIAQALRVASSRQLEDLALAAARCRTNISRLP